MRMSTASRGAQPAPTAQSAVTVNIRELIPASSQPARSGAGRTEKPSNPPNPHEENAVGNPNLILSFKLEGQLGLFYPRHKTSRTPTLINIDFDAIRGAVSRVLTFALLERADKTPHLDDNLKVHCVREIVTYLANGVCVMTYLRLHSINYYHVSAMSRYRRKPEVPTPFEIPAPYALAISQLGPIKISNLPEELFLAPTVPAESDITFGCSNAITWSPAVYSEYVLQAKKLGLQFSSVDLDVKSGSSWWLFRPDDDGQRFTLQAPYPEENFTVNTAILASLFCNTEAGGFNNPIIDLDSLGTKTFGTFLRKPDANLSLNSFYAIVEEKEV